MRRPPGARLPGSVEQVRRELRSGRYAPRDMDAVCKCGHTLAMHTAERSHGSQPCIVGDFTGDDCDCDVFRRAQ